MLNMGMLSVHDVFVDPMRSKIALFNRFRGERGAALSIVMVWGGGVGGRSAGAKPVS